jgi:hypothetical protein
MAITITDEPQFFTPVYNDVIFVCTSDNTAETNFNFVFDIYVEDVFISRHFVPPHPVSGHGIFKANRVLQSYLSYDITEDVTAIMSALTSSMAGYQIKVGERYDVAGVPTVDADLAESTEGVIFNGSFKPYDFIDYDEDDWTLQPSATNGFLTNDPSPTVRSGDRLYLNMFAHPSTDISFLSIKRYTSAGVLIGETTVSGISVGRFAKAGIGHKNITEIYGSTFLDTTSYYTVQAINDSVVATSKLLRVDIDTTCSKYEVVRLQFLNSLGGFDGFNFSKVSKNNIDVQRTGYKKNVGSVVSDVWTVSKMENPDQVLSTKIMERVTLNSDWISEDQAVWLKELISSPVVFQEIDNEFIGVRVLTSSYEVKKSVNEKLFNLTIELEYPSYTR